AAGLTVGALRDAVVAANPALPRDSLFVATSSNQWLTELRVCLTTRYEAVACENGDIGAADRASLRVRRR
ncbi:MAG: ribonuclease, partial [Pseudomonadota bacterium]|nr:ribonuclease [Pseudomonadota bacterium]